MRGSVALLLLAVAASGCFAGGDAEPGGTPGDDPPPGGNETGNVTPPPPPPPNRRPLPTMDASPLVGAAPLEVVFQLGGADPDDDKLNWTLDVDSDGTTDHNGSALPVEVKHRFEAEGIYEVLYRLDDGRDSAQSVLTINVTPDLGPGPSLEPLVIEGRYTGIDPTSRCNFGNFDVGGQWHRYLRDVSGWHYRVEPNLGIKVNFVAEDGTSYVGGTLGSQGRVPKDAVEVDICTDDPNAGGTYTFSAIHPSLLD